MGGVWQIPHGDEFYRFLIHQFTTTDMTPADVHALGLEQVAQVHAQIEEVMHRIGFQGSLREFMDKTRADPKFYNENTDAGREAFLTRARAIVSAMQARIPDEFESPAPFTLEV